MTYIVDIHVFIWYLDRNNRLKTLYRQMLTDKYNNFVFSIIVLAEIKYLISLRRLRVDFDKVIDYLSGSENCIVYPIDEDVVGTQHS
jgi:PIN domain nuclease of toxin-antitoxin system